MSWNFFPKFDISLPVLTNLFKLLTTPFMQSLQWSITGHERRAAVSAGTSTALIEKYSQEQIPDR